MLKKLRGGSRPCGPEAEAFWRGLEPGGKGFGEVERVGLVSMIMWQGCGCRGEGAAGPPCRDLSGI